MGTTVIGTADGKETFEVRKQYNVDVKSAIIYKKNLYSAREQISKNTKCSYCLEQVKTILKLIKPILERNKVEEVRTLILYSHNPPCLISLLPDCFFSIIVEAQMPILPLLNQKKRCMFRNTLL